MKILVLSNLYPPNVIGGYERLCFEVASELAACGHEIVVLTSDFGGRTADYVGQRVHRTLRLLTGPTVYEPYAGTKAERAAINLANIAAARAVIESERPSVIFVWNLFFLDTSFLDAVQEHGIRTVLMLTDNWLIVMRHPQFMVGFFDRHTFGDLPFPLPGTATTAPAPGLCARLRRWLAGDARAAVQPADPRQEITIGAIFGSQFMRDLHHASGLAFAEEKVIHNGVRQQPRPDTAFRDRSRLVLPDELRLLFAGRVTEFKGLHTALDALPLLDPAALGVNRIRLTIVGDTQDQAYLAKMQERIRTMQGGAEIELRDLVPESELFALFQNHDIYLFPSLYEPFSLTLIHALSAGIPTVASHVGGNVEIVRERETGMLFCKSDGADLARAIRELALGSALRVRVAASAQSEASIYTFENMVSGMAEFLQPRA